MSQVPSDYTPNADFSTLAETPITTAGLPGAQLDAEFAEIATFSAAINDRLGEIQRDDGQIRNGMVKIPALSAEVLALVTVGAANYRTWFPLESYEVGDFVSNPETPKLVVTGDSAPDYNGTYSVADNAFSERLSYYRDIPFTAPYVQWYDGPQGLGWYGGDINNEYFFSEEDVEDPGDVSAWAPFGGATGDFIVASEPLVTEGTYYSISDHLSEVSFSADLANWALIAAPPSAGNLSISSFTGDGSDVTFVLSSAPLSEANTQVFIDGVYQSKSTYSLSGSTITFSTAPANAAAIEVVSGVTVEIQTAVVADGAVTTDKLATDAVTTAKIADGSVTAAKLASGAAVADDSITAAKLQSNSVTTAKIAAGNVTEGKLATGAVTEDKLATGAVSATKLATSAVTETKIATGAVVAAKLATGAVETAKINDSAVTAAKIADGAVTLAKIPDATITAAKLASGTLDTLIAAAPGVVKAACRFSLSSSPALVGNDVNVATVARTGTGIFRVTFTTALASANYLPILSIITGNSKTAAIEATADATTTTVDISVRNSGGSLNDGLNTEAVSLLILAP